MRIDSTSASASKQPAWLVGLAMALPMVVLASCIFWLLTPNRETRDLCRAAAETVLTSENLLHVQRAIFITDGLNCKLSRTVRRQGAAGLKEALGR